MKYAMLIYPNLDGQAALDEDAARAVTGEYMALREDARFLEGAALQPAGTATTVRQAGTETLITDGPFADAKEVLGGYYVVEASDLDDALEFAQRIPAVRFGGAIEVRPLIPLPVETAR